MGVSEDSVIYIYIYIYRLKKKSSFEHMILAYVMHIYKLYTSTCN